MHSLHQHFSIKIIVILFLRLYNGKYIFFLADPQSPKTLSQTISLNNFTILLIQLSKTPSSMQKPIPSPLPHSSFKKALLALTDPIPIQHFDSKLQSTQQPYKKIRYSSKNQENHSRNFCSPKYPQFIATNRKNPLQSQLTSINLANNRNNKTVERICNSKDKKSTQYSSRLSFNNISQFTQKQLCISKNWINEAKLTSFNDFQSTSKPQNQNHSSRFSFFQNSKLRKYKPIIQYHNFDSLRQTEDTISEKISLEKTSEKNVKIEDFSLKKLLGKGKNGEVYLAIHKVSGFACGLKIIKKGTLQKGNESEKKKSQDQLLNEIKIQTYLRHSNLIELYGVFDDEQNIYLIQQLGVNGQLYEFMKKKGKFSQETTALISRDIISGIQYMHHSKVIHRDLKPENMVMIYGVCKICDFGWSIYNDDSEIRSTLCGTLLYISPQMLTGCSYNQKIDVWAYGILVYELFTGENPFRIKQKTDLNRVVTDQVKIGDNVPQKLKDFLIFVLHKQIELRPSANQIRRHKWLQKYQDLQTSQELAEI